jgi:phospholipid/cholesterol/gamma-HCH transport system substrate-binding protein
MANEARTIRVGVFLLAGIILLVAVLLLFVARHYFSDTRRYATYFSESIQGLDRTAPVKYNGLQIGHVSAIRLAPDGKLIEVVMDINCTLNIHRTNLVARLQNAGITGVRYIELSLRAGREHLEPARAFKSDFLVIPSYPAAQMFDLLDIFNTKMQGIDTAGISTGMVAALQQINTFFATNIWQPIFGQLRTSVATADRISKELDGYITAGGMSNLIADATATMQRVRAISEHIRPADLDRLLCELTSLTVQLKASVYAIDSNLQPMLQDMQQTMDNLRSFSEALKTRPNQTLFGQPVKREQ